MENIAKFLISSSLMNIAFCGIQAADSDNAKKQPNVIFVLTDDQGYGDLGCHGNNIIKTPNIDKFYSDAVRLTNFHSSPTSAPTRSSLMTGRYANRVGVWHTIGGRSILFDEEVVLPQMLSEAGYVNGIFGKWHLGDNYPNRPEDRGFHEVLVHGGGGISQGPDYFGNDYFADTYRHNGKFEKYDKYCTDVFFGEAIKFIEKNKNNPFFCYIALNAPHGPLNVPEKYHKMYMDEDRILDQQKRFYGMITNVDDNFAILRKKLKDLKIEDNTILIFMTDNGTANGVKKKNNKVYGFSGNMRGVKNSEYEGGHRVPFFIRYPQGGIEGGKDIDRLTAHLDFLPTIAELCGVNISKYADRLDGRSLCPLLNGNKSNWPKDRTIIVDSQRRQNLVKWNKCAVMTEEWRLVNGKELYKIKEDPTQANNIAAKYPEKVKELRAEYEKWWKSLQDEKCNERYAYVKAGGKENPVRISAHDMHTESTLVHNHIGVLNAFNPLGIYKIEILETGKYKIDLCRYPRETGYNFNSKVDAVESSIELEKGSPAAKNVDFKEATLNFAQYTMRKKVDMNKPSVSYELKLEAGRYDLDAFFTDVDGKFYPIYYIYIEKL